MGSFPYRSAGDLLEVAAELGVELPFQESISPLLETFTMGGATGLERPIPNRLVVHPMEGFDSEKDGSPGDLTFRRYRRYARGGSGLIWFEATAVVPEGRSNPRQLMLDGNTLGGFRQLVEQTREGSAAVFGPSHNPMLVLQLTHSGRFSKPGGKPDPLIGAPNPLLDPGYDQVRVVADDELEQVRERCIAAALLAREAGFDGVDIKACHGYLVHELLSSFMREGSRYGGEDLENRARLLIEIIEGIGDAAPDLPVAVRLNVYDGLPWPHGFGMRKDGSNEPDPEEPFELIGRLRQLGVSLLNVTAGVPHHNSYMGRPCNRSLPGDHSPPEHPIEGIWRLIRLAGDVQRRFPDLAVVGTGYSWLRQFFPNVAAAVLESGGATLIGLGRSSFAYPDAPGDLLEMGRLDPGKVCVTCSGCTELTRHGCAGGCIVRDREVYGAEYRELRARLRRKAE